MEIQELFFTEIDVDVILQYLKEYDFCKKKCFADFNHINTVLKFKLNAWTIMVLMNFGSEKCFDITYICKRVKEKKRDIDRLTVDYQFDVMEHEINRQMEMSGITKDNITQHI